MPLITATARKLVAPFYHQKASLKVFGFTITEFSVRTGKRIRVLYQRRTGTEAGDTAVYWVNTHGTAMIAVRGSVFGVQTPTTFTPLPPSTQRLFTRPGPMGVGEALSVRAIESVHAGDGTLSPAIARRLIALVAGDQGAATRREQARQRLASLTPREYQVATSVGEGRSNADIAGQLHMSPATVKAHVSRLLLKLGVDNRVQVALLVQDAGADVR